LQIALSGQMSRPEVDQRRARAFWIVAVSAC
jgi:hypothetical protein